MYFVVADNDGVTVSEDGNKLIVRGKTDKAGENVTVVVQEKGGVINKVLAMGQTTTDANGRYGIELDGTGFADKYCLVNICEGEAGRKEYLGNSKFRFDTKLFVNGEESIDVWNIKENDIITIEGKISDLDGANEAITVYAADYSGDNTLNKIDVSPINSWVGNETEVEVTAQLNYKIKFMVWNGSGSPVADMTVID